jgi:hypothetical protein
MKEMLLKKWNSVSNITKAKAFSIGCGLGTMLLPLAAHADDTTGLDPTVQASIASGFTTAGTAVATIVGLGVVACVGVIATSGGAKAGLKWIKGAFSKAS